MKKYEKEDVSENIVEVEEQPGKSLFLFSKEYNSIAIHFFNIVFYFTFVYLSTSFQRKCIQFLKLPSRLCLVLISFVIYIVFVLEVEKKETSQFSQELCEALRVPCRYISLEFSAVTFP